jgi:anti-sigma regulatory factor (Ser/Thr protein kinase)
MAENRSFKFRSRPEAVSAARKALDGFDSFLDAPVFYDASLCVSELVTNAVLHSDIAPDGELLLDVTIDDDGSLRVTVTDSGPGFDPPQPTRGDESGWGLFIVDRLAHRWGVERRAAGTRVWFEMGTRASREENAADERATASGSASETPEAPRERVQRRGPVGRLRLGTQAPA